MSTVTCPHCLAILKSDPLVPAGTKVKCKKCRGSFVLAQKTERRHAPFNRFAEPLTSGVFQRVLQRQSE